MLKQKQAKTGGNNSSILYYLAAGVCILVGIAGLYFYSQSLSIIYAMMTLAGLGGGAGIIYWQMQKASRSGSGVVKVGGKKLTVTKLTDENCLNIYPATDDFTGKLRNDAIKFEKMDGMKGQPWKFRANNQFYYLNVMDPVKNVLMPYNLKDGVFVDPVDLAGALECRPVRKYLKHRESLMKYVGPAILVVAFIIECVIIIAMGG